MKKRILTLLAVLCLLLTMALPAYAAGEAYIYETTGVLLTDAEILQLEQMCADAAEQHGCGIYVVTLNEFSQYHRDPLYAAEEIYRSMGFGVGENKNGILLMLSMSERDFAMVAYGDIANSVFTDRKQDAIIDDFLDNFSSDDWEGGLTDYVENCVYYLETFDGVIGEAYPGHYEDGVYYKPTLGEYMASMWMPCFKIGLYIFGVVALVFCIIQVARMRTVHVARNADSYVPVRGVDVRIREDVFLYKTHRKIVHADDDDGGSFSGGTTVRSSGFSGRSGKF